MAYVAVDECYGLNWLNDAIDALDTCIDGQLQLSLHASVQDLLLSRMVWYVRNVDFKDGLEAVVARFGPAIRQIAAGLDDTLPPDLQAVRAKRRQDLTDAGVPAGLAGELADLDSSGLGTRHRDGCGAHHAPIGDAAATFFAAEANFRLDRIVAAARSVPANDYFERMAIDRAVEQIAGPKEDWPRTCWQPASPARRPSRPGSRLTPKRPHPPLGRGDCGQRPDARQADGGGEPAGGPGQGLRAPRWQRCGRNSKEHDARRRSVVSRRTEESDDPRDLPYRR